MSPDNQPTDRGTEYFFPEWVTAIFYGGEWHDVRKGTFQEGLSTSAGEMAVYEDPYAGEVVFLTEPITGYRVRKPEASTEIIEGS